MSLVSEVVALIEEREAATVDDLLPDLEGYTRAQVMTALDYATTRRLITCDGPRGPKGLKGRGGSLPGVYRRKPQAASRLGVRSVWELAQRASV